jgi:hypothetical protein
MKYLKISNKGVVEPEAFSLVGASTKRNDDSKIGMFGSGNKYAISFLFRNKMNFRVFTGGREMTFTTVEKAFAGKTFDVIVIDGKETSLTTEMGPKWKLWQAIRELYSNAMDEGLIEFKMVDAISDDEPTDETSIYIEANMELLEMHFEIDKYFSHGRVPIYENKFGKIYKSSGKSCVVYRKGIKAIENEKPGIFDYDLNDLDLTEDRIARYSWDVPQGIWNLLELCDDDFIVRKLLMEIPNREYFENNVDDSFVTVFTGGKFPQVWKEALCDSKIAPRNMGGFVKDEERAKTTLLPSRLYNAMVASFGKDLKTQSFKTSDVGLPYVIVEQKEFEKKILNDVKGFFTECKFDIDYDIRIVDFKDADIHGSIEGETILIDINAFERGKVWIANVIIEEYIHIKHNAADESRKFQDASIGELLTYMQKINSFLL